jgi:hypothetical protein
LNHKAGHKSARRPRPETIGKPPKNRPPGFKIFTNMKALIFQISLLSFIILCTAGLYVTDELPWSYAGIPAAVLLLIVTGKDLGKRTSVILLAAMSLHSCAPADPYAGYTTYETSVIHEEEGRRQALGEYYARAELLEHDLYFETIYMPVRHIEIHRYLNGQFEIRAEIWEYKEWKPIEFFSYDFEELPKMLLRHLDKKFPGNPEAKTNH